MALIQTVHLSMANFKSAPVVPAVQNDTDRQVKMIIDDYTLTSGLTGKIAFERSDGTHYETAAELVLADNAFTADIDQALTQPGRTMVQLKVTDTLTVSTFSFVIFVEQDNSGTVTPQEGIDLVSAVQAAEDAADRAESAASMFDEDVQGYVNEWLDAHPEVTTTVQDGAITYQKLNDSLKIFVTPETFGAIGDGITDDTNAINLALASGYPVVCNGVYAVSDTINVEKTLLMVGSSKFVAVENIQVGVLIANSGTQQVNQTYEIRYDANGFADIGIACANVKNSILRLYVKNSTNIGIVSDYMAYTNTPTGNNQNDFHCYVEGMENGLSNVGVLVNVYDSVFRMINTKNVKYGAKAVKTFVIIDNIHSWISQNALSGYWDESAVIYFESSADIRIGWLYQDTVRYGAIGTNGFVSVTNFLENTADYSGAIAPINVKITNNTIYSCFTVTNFKTTRGQGAYMTWEGFVNTIKYGCYSDLDTSYSNDQLTNTFDANTAPTIGAFNCKWNVQNLPKDVNGVLVCDCYATFFTQTYYWLSGTMPTIYKRIKSKSSQTWGDWRELSSIAPS